MTGALGAGFALIGSVQQRNSPFLIVAVPLLRIILWVFGAVCGVVALWTAILVPSIDTLRQSQLRWWTVSGLVVGFLSAATWLYSMAHMRELGIITWLVWILLLGGPIVMSVAYAVLLARIKNTV
jgi:hypothetical protein